MRVFISYRRDDLGGHAPALVGRIYDRLSSHYGEENIFMDVDTIPPGADFASYLGEAVEKADVLLAVVGPDWTELLCNRVGESNDFVRVEVESALERSVPVVPLLVGGAAMPKDSELPESLSAFVRRNAFPVDSGRDFNSHLTRLIADLEKHYEAQADRGEEVTDLSGQEESRDELQLERESEAPGDAAESLVSGEVSGLPLGPQTSGRVRRAGLPAWVLVLGAIVMIGIALGIGRPWSPRPPDFKVALNRPDVGKGSFSNSIDMELLWCPPGTFLMGSPESEEGRDPDEPLHRVTLSEGFWMATTETTQREWLSVVGENPSPVKKLDGPVNVNDLEAIEFCQALTERERRIGLITLEWEYRLPTEAQWEYACRAGTATPFSFGSVLDETQANFGIANLYPEAEQPSVWFGIVSVRRFPANPWGFYDMHGNVAEWCLDWYSEYPEEAVSDPTGPLKGDLYERVLRGGGYESSAGECRSASRVSRASGTPYGWAQPGGHPYRDLGFRPVLARVGALKDT